MQNSLSNDLTIALVHRALDASVMRQKAIAYTIANSNSLQHDTITVNFEEQLGENALTDLEEIQPRYQISDTPSSLDQQIALNVQNLTHYRALIKGLNHKLAIMNLALQGSNS